MHFSYKRNNIYFKKYIIPIILFIISLVIIWPYLRSGVIIGCGESAISINPSYTNPFYLWNERINMGRFWASQAVITLFFIFWKIFNIFSFWIHPSIIYIFLAFYLPGLFLYFLLNQIINFDNKLIFLPSCLLYSFNIFRITTTYQNECLSLLFVFLPLFFLFYHKLLEKKEWKYVFILILISIASSTMGNNFSVFIIPYFLLFIYLIFYIFTHKLLEIKKIFLLNIVFLLLATIGNLFWIVPILKYLFQLSQTLDTQNPWNVIKVGSFLDQFRYMGSWAWRSGWGYGLYYPFFVSYDKPILLITTFFISILSLLYVFLKKHKLYKNMKNFFALLIIFSYFLVSGAKGPLGFFYEYFYNNFMIFKMFREPYTKFMPLFIFATTVGLTLSVFYLSKVFKSKIYLNIFISVISLIILFNAYPLFTKQAIVFQRWNQAQVGCVFKIPKYWEESISYLSKYKLDEQIFLPLNSSYGSAYNFEYGISVVGNLADFLLVENKFIRSWGRDSSNTGKTIKNLFENIDDVNWQQFLGFLGSKRVLVQNDAEWRYGEKGGSPSAIEKLIEKQKLKKVAEFGKFTKEYLAKIPNEEPNKKLHNEFYQELTGRSPLILYEFDNQYFLPHFYIPQNVIYANSDIELLPEIIGFGDWEVRSVIFLTDNTDKKKQIALINRTDEIFIEGKIKNEEILKQIWDDKTNVSYPAIKHNPNSWQWQFVLLKEKYDEWKVGKNSEKLIKKKLFYANKRINEIEKYAPAVRNIPADADKINRNNALSERKYIRNMLASLVKYIGIEQKDPFIIWLQNINEAVNLLEKIGDEEKKAELAVKIKNNIEDNKGKLKNMPTSASETNGNTLADASEIKKLEEKLDGYIPNFDIEKREYEVEIPKEGVYTLLLKFQIPNSKFQTPKLKLEIDGKETDSRYWILDTEEDRWAEWGKVNLKEGKHNLTLYFNEIPNLLDINKLTNKKDKTDIEYWQEDQWYQVKGELVEETEIDQEKIIIEQKDKEEEEKKEEAKWEEIKMYQPNENEFTFYFKSGNSSELGRLVLENITLEDFENLSVRPVWEPKIVLRNKLANTNETRSAEIKKSPKIEFTKINPTKYRIKVKESTEPYTLVFSESFHSGWRLYVASPRNKMEVDRNMVAEGDRNMLTVFAKLGNWGIRTLGKTGGKITGLFLKDKGYGEEVASHFDGEIKEGTHRMTFLEPATFETWGKEPITEDGHLLVNGYANSWYITPNDVGGAENYELIVEFWPQRLLYLGLFISISIFTGCIIFLIYDKFRNKINV